MKSFLVTTGALVLAAGLSDCGSSGGDGGSKTSPWVGSWTETGTETAICGAISETTDLGGVVVISAGAKSGTIQTSWQQTSSSSACLLTWDVSGDNATLESGQSCTFLVFGSNANVAWATGSATLSGTTVTGTLGGAADNGCSSVTQQFALMKM
jgi:hypothetical protein